MRFLDGCGVTVDSAMSAALVTFSCMLTDRGGAPMMPAMRSPTSSAISHHRSSHARTPRVAQVVAYSASESATPRGIAPSELLIM